MDSVSETNPKVDSKDEKSDERQKDGVVTGSRDTPSSTVATKASTLGDADDSSRGVAEDSTERKLGGCNGDEKKVPLTDPCRGEKHETDDGTVNDAKRRAVVPDLMPASDPSSNDGPVDSGDTGTETKDAAEPESKKPKIVDNHNEVRVKNLATAAADNDDDSDSDGASFDKIKNISTSSRSPTSGKKDSDISRTIPRKKKRRLEHQRFGEDAGGDYTDRDDDPNDVPMEVSLSQLKRQVLGRDLNVDDGEHGWGEDQEDSEIRQIRALMSAPNANDEDDKNPPETHDAKGLPGDKGNTHADNAISMKTTPSPAASLSEKLRKDLVCAICHEVVYPPVALQCGHSFCQPCINWWFDHDDAGRCPTCRRRSYSGNNKEIIGTSPNLALRACVMAMFGPEIVTRLQNRKKLRPRGECSGAHVGGYQVLSELRDETWHYVAVGTSSGNGGTQSNNLAMIQVRRSIVLDAEDQRMQLALAVYDKPIKEAGKIPEAGDDPGGPRGCFRVELCLLTMEEDEAVDSGFPTNILTPDDEFFVCGGHHGNSRFLYTNLEVQMKDESGRLSPLARVSSDTSDGRFKYVFDPAQSAGDASTENIRALLFQHSETGSQLEIDLAQLQNRAGGSSLLPPDRNREQTEKNHYRYSDDDEEEYDYTNSRRSRMDTYEGTDEGNEERENLDEFEEDGFVVGETDEESNVRGNFSGDDDGNADEGDVCVICKEGGELMICDGGDKNPGCGKSFHASCVHRSAIPDGDWICQACAKAGGIEAGIIGHEFPVTDETPSATPDEQDFEQGASSDALPKKENETSDVEGAFSDEDNKDDDSRVEGVCSDEDVKDDHSRVEGAFSDGDDKDDHSRVEGAFSDDDDEDDHSCVEEAFSDDNEERTNKDVDAGAASKQDQLDCDDAPVVKPSGNGNNNSTKRRFVLEDSDSD